jgi:hypothetical protein
MHSREFNLVSNSLDAISEAKTHGHLDLSVSVKGDSVLLSIKDNGIGIGQDRLKLGPDRLPLFVGKTTKPGHAGEGIGTRQVFSTFGPENITVESVAGQFTQWNILLKKSSRKETSLLTKLGSIYAAYMKATARIGLTPKSSQTEIGAFIWQLREMEVLSYDLVYQFSRHNNVRDIYRTIMAFRYGKENLRYLRAELKEYRVDYEQIRAWLRGIVSRIKRNENYLKENTDYDTFQGVLFKSYGQARERTMIFTMDPDTGRFSATDRRMAEHADFIQYLGGDRNRLLRGELSGDLNNVTTPIYLGIWSATSHADLRDKVRIIQRGAQRLLSMGLKAEKKLAFYNTTFNSSESEIDTLKVTTIGEFSVATNEELDRYLVSSEDELRGLAMTSFQD